MAVPVDAVPNAITADVVAPAAAKPPAVRKRNIQHAADAGQHPSVAVIGDSTFTHSGMTGLLDAVNERADITVIISDNLTTGMTGGQDSAGTGRLEQICAGIGVDPAHIRTVVPLPKNREEMKAVIREEIAHRGVSVIIPRRECIQTAKRHNAAKK